MTHPQSHTAALLDLRLGVEMDKHYLDDGEAKLSALDAAIAALSANPPTPTAALREAIARQFPDDPANAARAHAALTEVLSNHPTGWRDIATAPKDGCTLLLGYFNSHGKWRTLRGQWMNDDYIAENWEDPDDAEAGWYETAVEAEEMPNCWRIHPTHWQPLPDAPGAHPAEQQEGDAAGEKDAALLQAMAAEWDRARRGVDSHMPIWDALCEAVGDDADGAGMRQAISAAMQAMNGEGN